MKIFSFLMFCLIMITLSLSCSTMPLAKQEQSLLIVPWESMQGSKARLILQGDEDISISLGDSSTGYTLVSVHPGSYQLNWGNYRRVLDIPEQSVILLDSVLILEAEGESSRLLSEEERQKIADHLSLYYNYLSWSHYDMIGFGEYIPGLALSMEHHQLQLSSQPEGAQVYINEEWVGETPFNIKLPVDRYSLLLKQEGYQNQSLILPLEEDQSLSFTLEPQQVSLEREQFRMAVNPFVNDQNSQERQVGQIFAQTLTQSLKSDPRLEVEYNDSISWDSQGSTRVPLWYELENQGTELLLSGSYRIEGNSLVVMAYLYDVTARSIKTSLFFTGQAGLDIYDAIDEMTSQLVEQVDRVLPAAGKVLVEQKELVQSGLNSQEGLMLRYHQRDLRVEQPWSISWYMALHGTAGGDHNPFMRNKNGGGIPALGFKADYRYTDHFSLGGYFRLWNWHMFDGSFASTAGVNPQLVFASRKSDIFIGIPVSLYLANPVSFEQDHDGALITIKRGWTYGILSHFNMGFRGYWQEKPGGRNWFWETSLLLSLLGYGWDPRYDVQDSLSMDVDMSVGVGYRL